MIITFQPISTGNDYLDLFLVVISLIVPFIIAIIVVYSDGGNDDE